MTTNRVRQLFLGSELSDAELEDIPSPRMELHAHVMTKFVQVREMINLEWEAPGTTHPRPKKHTFLLPYSFSVGKFKNPPISLNIIRSRLLLSGMFTDVEHFGREHHRAARRPKTREIVGLRVPSSASGKVGRAGTEKAAHLTLTIGTLYFVNKN